MDGREQVKKVKPKMMKPNTGGMIERTPKTEVILHL